MAVSVEKVDIISDQRGYVLEPLDSASLMSRQNLHLVVTLPGAVRGNHYHQKGTETITVMGRALVRFREGDTLQDITVPHDQAYQFVFPPGVAHAIQNTGKQSIILIAFNTQKHDREHPDIVRDILITA
ncbi:MAG: hypothetical protein JW786_07185 [Desulfobacterales bacterium]|nr:hypothetical protein [Desulfobacterales bacterium]